MKRMCKALKAIKKFVCGFFALNGASLSEKHRQARGLQNNGAVTVNKYALRQHAV